MHRPGAADLLAGVHAGLERDVLPELESGAAQRQLKASLHVLRRLERSWDRLPAYLDADNADLRDTLARLAQMLDDGTLRDGLAEAKAADGTPADENVALQELTTAADARLRAGGEPDPALRASGLALLGELYRRMLDREGWAWGTS